MFRNRCEFDLRIRESCFQYQVAGIVAFVNSLPELIRDRGVSRSRQEPGDRC